MLQLISLEMVFTTRLEWVKKNAPSLHHQTRIGGNSLLRMLSSGLSRILSDVGSTSTAQKTSPDATDPAITNSNSSYQAGLLKVVRGSRSPG